MIQIDFFDKDIVSTLLPISTMEPDKVIFLIDKSTISGRDPENVTRVIKAMLPNTEVEFEPVTIDAMEDIYNTLKNIIDGTENKDEIHVDLTGGTELMSACGNRIALENNLLSIYVDVKREHVINAQTGEVIKPVNHITLENYMMAIGAKRLKDSHDLPTEEEYESILAMSEIIFSHIVDWQKLCQHIANTVASSGLNMKIRIPAKIGKTESGTKALVRGFIDNGFLIRIDGGTVSENGVQGEYQFTNNKAKSYMTNYGVWLELYIYIKALKVYPEAAIGVVIDWFDGDHIDTQDNEIDVVAMRKSIPVFISCKMRKPVSGDLYEIGFLASRLGGSRVKPILATTYPVKEMGTSPKRMYQRMKKLRVGLIEAQKFLELPSADVFNQAVQMTE